MLVEVRDHGTITIPNEIVNQLGLVEGDMLDIVEMDGMLTLLPVAVYPKKIVDELHKVIKSAKDRLSVNGQDVFKTVDDLLAELEHQ